MSAPLQLFVVRRGLDPAAWTALHTLRETHPEWVLGALARAELWEFTTAPGVADEALRAWVEGANWFANATRDRLLWRESGAPPPPLAHHAAREDGTVGGPSEGGFLLVVWRDAFEAEAHAVLARQALAESVTIRRGTVWWLGVAKVEQLPELRAVGESAGGGLLANPQSQWWRWLGPSFPSPALDAAGTDQAVIGVREGAS